MSTYYFAVLASRLGLQFPPMGSTIPNTGVEDGARAVHEMLIDLIYPSDGAKSTHHTFTKKFALPESLESQDYLQQTLREYDETVAQLLEQWPHNQILISLGGDHSTGYISLSAVLKRFGVDSTCVIMFDSHADLNTPQSSTTGNFHGMWLRSFFDGFEKNTLANEKIKPVQLRYVGNLVLDDAERNFLQENEIKVYSSELATQQSALEIATWAHRYPHLHISFDIDIFAQHLVSATGTPNPNGFEFEHVMIFLKAIKNHPSISLDIVEFNPHKEGHENTLKIIKQVFSALFDV